MLSHYELMIFEKRKLASHSTLHWHTPLVNRMWWMDLLLRTFRLVLEAASRVIFGIMYHGAPNNPLPPITNLVLLESATALATKIRTKKVLIFTMFEMRA